MWFSLVVVCLSVSTSTLSVGSFHLADLTLASKPYAVPEDNANEYQKCLTKKKVFYKNNCWELLTRGPCGKGQWLVIDPDGLDDFEQPIKALCVRRRCSEGDVYWPLDGFCHQTKESADKLCPSHNTQLANDYYGEGYCKCTGTLNVPYVRIDDKLDSACYPVYTRGPCPLGFIVTETDVPGYGNCTTDVCRWRWTDQASESAVPQIPWTDGRCYEPDTSGPCANNEEFTVLRETGRPGCATRLTELNLFSSMPVRCNMDHTGECVDEVQIVNTTRAEYTAHLLASAVRHKRTKKRRTSYGVR
ncbi:uncharacterized protein LOC126835315 [Adelges cooleyi]|uniref:uncharacterized protein LOC126835315 n=1 Tax=Adelges cooleyi TaxID=133065 RepID=UPI00217F94A2|nr:uncharacterized protein LOC126835315 [Adelges cooleyi]